MLPLGQVPRLVTSRAGYCPPMVGLRGGWRRIGTNKHSRNMASFQNQRSGKGLNLPKIIQNNKDETLIETAIDLLDKTEREINLDKNRKSIDFYDVSHHIQKYCIDLTEQVRRKIKSFIDDTFVDDLSLSAAKISLMELNNVYNNISDLRDEMKISTNAEDVTMKIFNVLTNLGINVPKESTKHMIKQGKYFKVLDPGRSVELNRKTWDEIFKRTLTRLDESSKAIQGEIREEAEKLNFRIVSNLYEIADAIQNHYNTEIRKLSDIQKLPDKLAKEYDVMTKMIGVIEKATTTSELVKTIHDCANMLGIIVPKEHMLDITNQGRYLEFLKNASKGELMIGSSTWTKPFETVVKNLHQSQKWYTFLNALYNRLSEYEIQMNREGYNVANLEDWGNTNKPKGIKITSTTYNEFLNKITKFNITEQDDVRNIPLTEQQLEELNHVLKFTLDHRLNIKCEKPFMTLTRNYFSLRETIQSVLEPIDEYEGCAKLNVQNFTNYNIFALNTIFIDNDLPMSFLKTQFLSIMAPKWEVVKKSRIDVSGAKGLSHVGPLSLFRPQERLKAANGTRPGAKGADGKPGGPGEPGGNILAIGDTFVNGKDMILSVNGGEGGTGEHGGDGYSGKPSELGNGGNGGRGGKGGVPGTIILFELSGDSGVVKMADTGKPGEDGDGGRGGSAGWNGPYGKRGVDGGNTVGLVDPKPSKILKDPAKVVNKYKTYLLENMVDPFTRTHYIQFLEKIDNNDKINNIYDTTGFIEEFEGLEKQFPLLNKDVDFIPLYKPLLPRISEYSKSPKGDEKSDQYKKVLNFLYTATLGRIFNLEDNSDSNLIINIGGYLDIVKREIKTLRDLQKENNKAEIISKYQERYKDNLDKKIEEAKNIIGMITPEIENISKDIDGKIDLLVDETIELEKKAEKEKEALEKKKQELEKAMAVRGIFSCLSIFGQVLSFFGPIGAIAGTVIGATSSVAESLVLDSQQQDVQMPPDVIPKLKILGDQIKSVREKKVKYLSKLLEEVSQEIGKNPKKLGDMSEKINDLKSRLNKAKENAYDSKKIKAVESELKQELKNKEGQLKIKGDTPDEKTKGALKAVEKLSQAAQLGSLLVDVYNKHKSDQAKIDAISDAIEQTDGQIAKLKEYEEQIYEVISPTLHSMESNLQDVASKLKEKSQASLEVTKWKVQSALRDMKLQMQQLTEGFQVKDNLARCIEKLEEVMTTLVNVYDRIQNYQDQQNLANYIADVSSASANSINISIPNLAKAVNNLEILIRSNVVLTQYKAAVNAFKQWVFPFASYYLEESMLPSQLQLKKNIENLVDDAVKQIENIKTKLDLYKTSVKKTDKYIHTGEFSSRYFSSEPFYVWKNDEYKDTISKLLSGQKIVLRADVKKSATDKDAIKFSIIDLHFKTSNETLQSQMDNLLIGFDVMATHLGNSYYRYADKIYIITSESQTISYSWEKNAIGEPIRRNNVFDKLKEGDLMLSPYSLWELKIMNSTRKVTFHDLEIYKDSIDLELSGYGSYVLRNENGFKFAHKEYSSVGKFDEVDICIESEARNSSECSDMIGRMIRSAQLVEGYDGYMTNGAATKLWSPLNYACNFLKMHIALNFVQFFINDEKNMNVEINSRITAKGSTNFINRKIEKTENSVDRVELARNELIKHNENHRSHCINVDHTENLNFSALRKSFLPNAAKEKSSCFSQCLEVNCTLLLADVVARTVTGEKYDRAFEECLLSPKEKLQMRFNEFPVRSEDDARFHLCNLSRMTDDRESSWLNRVKTYARSMLQYLGFDKNIGPDDCVEDIRNLYA